MVIRGCLLFGIGINISYRCVIGRCKCLGGYGTIALLELLSLLVTYYVGLLDCLWGWWWIMVCWGIWLGLHTNYTLVKLLGWNISDLSILAHSIYITIIYLTTISPHISSMLIWPLKSIFLSRTNIFWWALWQLNIRLVLIWSSIWTLLLLSVDHELRWQFVNLEILQTSNVFLIWFQPFIKLDTRTSVFRVSLT